MATPASVWELRGSEGRRSCQGRLLETPYPEPCPDVAWGWRGGRADSAWREGRQGVLWGGAGPGLGREGGTRWLGDPGPGGEGSELPIVLPSRNDVPMHQSLEMRKIQRKLTSVVLGARSCLLSSFPSRGKSTFPALSCHDLPLW